jgi:isopenicillin-N epimerase
MGSLLPGSWPQIMARNRELALAARSMLGSALKVPSLCPDECLGSLVSFPLPPTPPLQNPLYEKHAIEVPVIYWPAHPHRVVRISAQLYNSLPQYQKLAEALTEELG